MNDVRNTLEERFPRLHARIEEILVDSESRYNQQTNQAPSEFLLEHTRRTAAIAHKISNMEKVESFLPSLVALFHDAGKFHDGAYHKDDVPEEEHAAVLAEKILTEFEVEQVDIDIVQESLRALYDDRLPCVGPCRIVQDADRLDKLGALGVGAFFTKASLRGRGLNDALVNSLSREMTYALAAPRSMFTESGKNLASEQSVKTVAFFTDLLENLESWGIASFERRTIKLAEEFRTRDGNIIQSMEATIVMPRICPDCDSSLGLGHRRERGVKCEKLIAEIACSTCSHAYEISFCLPVFA